MLEVTKSVSGINIKDYSKCIRDTCQELQQVYQGYMLEITKSVSGIHVRGYQECIRDTYQGLQQVYQG